MKRILSACIASLMSISSFSAWSVAAAETDSTLWDKFLRYDLCITDYNALTAEEQELCHFIFDTEQAANDNIVCERARRILAGDEVGERVTKEQLASAYGLWDSQSVYNDIYLEHVTTTGVQACYTSTGWQTYIDCVPDVIQLEPYFCMEYWLDDARTSYVTFEEKVSPDTINQFVVFDSNGMPIEIIPTAFDCEMRDFRGNAEYMEQFGFIEKNGGYYYTKPDGTAVFAWSDASGDESQEPITEPFVIESEINGCPVTAIEHKALMKAPFTEIVLPDTLEIIDYEAFNGCRYLAKINFPKSLKYIGTQAFFNCNSLTEIVLDCPELKLQDAFCELRGLKTAYLNVKELGALTFCKSLESLSLGEDIKIIGYYAFRCDTLLDEITIPEGVEVIGQGAFQNFSSVTIPRTVKVIGAYSPKGPQFITSGVEPPPPIRPLTDEPICVFAEDCVIYGYEGTEAERYAKEWNLEFVALDVTQGDANCDDVVDISDVILLSRYTAEDTAVTMTESGIANADMNGDGILNGADTVAIIRKIAKLD